MKEYHMLCFVNGQYVGNDAAKMEVRNPANGQRVGTVPKLGEKQVDQAIDAAQRALGPWSQLPAGERARYLRKIHDLMIADSEELARMMTLEMGKPIAESRGEVKYAAAFIEWYAEEAKRLYGRTIPGRDANHRIQVLRQPVGVVAAITPWNFPAAMITRKLGPALAAGCTFVVKPSILTPLTAMKIMEYCQQAGLPAGVVNLVTGDSAEISDLLMRNEKVRKVTFTGSTEVGKLLIEKSAAHVKNLSLELGGHAPFIVLDDADLDKAVQGALNCKFRNTGQTCVCTNRIYVQEGVYDAFIEKFADKVRQFKVGDGLDETVQIGPIVDRKGFQKINEHVEDAIHKGAEIVAGGQPGKVENGVFFYQPTVIKNVQEDMIIMHEETFGPIAPVRSFKTDEEVIEMANHTPYGLAAYFYTENVRRGTRLAEALDYGIVGWNDGLPSAVQAPFGGMKQSGIGREGGREGIEEYLETKYLSLGL